MDYQDLYVAQVKTRAKHAAFIYAELQKLIKTRTKEGWIYGHAILPAHGNCDGRIRTIIDHRSHVIKAMVSVYESRTTKERYIAFHFHTYS